LSEYLHKADKFYKDEVERSERYLGWDEIKDALLKEFKVEMLFNHRETLLERETGINYLLQHDKTEDLSLLFNLYQDHPESL